ncbi:MAG: lipopolysaccharide biosynthesis protein [Roseicyclus sp.]|uniref:lipopolysaccharide biosynthesis protein n=1 Tax=Roseicyclus sp. TaxID=1914329 RepID=UPI003A83510A
MRTPTKPLKRHPKICDKLIPKISVPFNNIIFTNENIFKQSLAICRSQKISVKKNSNNKMEKGFNRFLAPGAIRSIGILTGGTAVANGITVLVTPVLTRVFTPEQFGSLAVFMALVAIVGTIVTLRYEVLIVPQATDQEAKNVVFLSIFLASLLGATLMAFSFWVPNQIWDFLITGGITFSIQAVFMLGSASAIVAVVVAFLNRHQLYKEIAWLKILQSFVFAAFAIFLGVQGASGGLILAHSVGIAVVFFVCLSKIGLPSQNQIAESISTAKRCNVAPRYMLPTAIVDVVTMQLPFFLISAWFNSAEAGQFSLAWRVLGFPALLLGIAVSQVFFQRFVAAWPDHTAARLLLLKTWRAMSLIGFIPMLAIFLYGDVLFAFLFGQEWARSGQMAEVLAPMLFLMFLHSPTSSASIALGLQRKVFLLSLILLITRPCSFLIGWWLDDLLLGLYLYCATEILHILLFQRLVIRRVWSRDVGC